MRRRGLAPGSTLRTQRRTWGTQPLGTHAHGRARDREARGPRIPHGVRAQAAPQGPLSSPRSEPGPCATAAALSPAVVL